MGTQKIQVAQHHHAAVVLGGNGELHHRRALLGLLALFVPQEVLLKLGSGSWWDQILHLGSCYSSLSLTAELSPSVGQPQQIPTHLLYTNTHAELIIA